MPEGMPTGKGQQGIVASFRNAYNGFVSVVRTQRNMRIHLVVAVGALAGGAALGLDGLEMAIVVLTVMVVFAAEMLNTALEFAVDLVTREHHPLARLAKDVAAAAVFATSIGAVVVGLLVAGDDLVALWPDPFPLPGAGGGVLTVAVLGVAFGVPVLLRALRAAGGFAPSAAASVAFAAWVAASRLAAGGPDGLLVSSLALLLALLVCVARLVGSARRRPAEVVSGAILGTLVSAAAFALL